MTIKVMFNTFKHLVYLNNNNRKLKILNGEKLHFLTEFTLCL